MSPRNKSKFVFTDSLETGQSEKDFFKILSPDCLRFCKENKLATISGCKRFYNDKPKKHPGLSDEAEINAALHVFFNHNFQYDEKDRKLCDIMHSTALNIMMVEKQNLLQQWRKDMTERFNIGAIAQSNDAIEDPEYNPLPTNEVMDNIIKEAREKRILQAKMIEEEMLMEEFHKDAPCFSAPCPNRMIQFLEGKLFHNLYRLDNYDNYYSYPKYKWSSEFVEMIAFLENIHTVRGDESWWKMPIGKIKLMLYLITKSNNKQSILDSFQTALDEYTNYQIYKLLWNDSNQHFVWRVEQTKKIKNFIRWLHIRDQEEEYEDNRQKYYYEEDNSVDDLDSNMDLYCVEENIESDSDEY